MSRPPCSAAASAARCSTTLIEAGTARGFRQMIAVIGDSPTRPARSACTRPCGFRHAGNLAGCRLQVRPLARHAADAARAWAGATTANARSPRRASSGSNSRSANSPPATATVDRAQHAVELVAAAHDQAGRRDHAIGALAARQLGIFFDAVDRDFRGAAEHREHRAVFQEVDGVIAPFAGGDLAAIEIENAVELAAAEGDLVAGAGARARRGCRPRGTGWDRFRRNRTSCGASFCWQAMIAPGSADGKASFRQQIGRKTGKNGRRTITNSLKAPTITPNFGQSPVTAGLG